MAQPGLELELTAEQGLLGPTHLVSHHASGPQTKTSTLGKPCLRAGKMLPELLLLSTLARLTYPLQRKPFIKHSAPPPQGSQRAGAPLRGALREAEVMAV